MFERSFSLAKLAKRAQKPEYGVRSNIAQTLHKHCSNIAQTLLKHRKKKDHESKIPQNYVIRF
jgi:hypothetical protein